MFFSYNPEPPTALHSCAHVFAFKAANASKLVLLYKCHDMVQDQQTTRSTCRSECMQPMVWRSPLHTVQPQTALSLVSSAVTSNGHQQRSRAGSSADTNTCGMALFNTVTHSTNSPSPDVDAQSIITHDTVQSRSSLLHSGHALSQHALQLEQHAHVLLGVILL
jgi:hypothetical protein